jgi:transposase-like protein
MVRRELKGLRRELRRQRGNGRGARYDSDLRGRVLAYCAERRAVGARQSEIARELGVHAWLVSRWRRGQGKFRSVEVSVVASAPVLRLVTPRGWVLEGLDVVSAAELLRRVQ